MPEGRGAEDTGTRADGPSLPTPTLPKGGGAIRGIDEKFTSNPSTGTGSLTVSIATSPARGGSAPALTLTYDSGLGNGPFGLGWKLSVPSISRRTDQQLPTYLDDDMFVLSGAEDLVPCRRDGAPDVVVEGGWRIQRYRPRIEGLFARIERWTEMATGDVHWRTITRDNAASLFGRSPAARIHDPEDPRRVFSWLLEETRDDRGNATRFIYRSEDEAGVDPGLASESNRFETRPGGPPAFLATAQRYLSRVLYGNRRPLARGEALPDAEDAWMFEVRLDYGELAGPPADPRAALVPPPEPTGAWAVRRDPFSSYKPGFELRTYRLCRRVLMFHRFPDELGVTPYLVRSTDFTYDEGPVVSYLTSVTQAGYLWDAQHSAYRRSTLPSLDLGYIRPLLHDELRAIDRESLAGVPGGVDGAHQQWVDLDGEGIPGLLVDEGRAWSYKRNLGEGKLGPPVRQRSLPSPAELGAGAHLEDLSGEGHLDLVTHARPLQGYFERGEDEWRPFRAFPALPNLAFDDRNLRFIDLDGDGRADALLTTDDALIWYRSLGHDGFTPALSLPKDSDERRGPRVVFADASETTFLADMSGDGLVDMVRIRNGDVCYWPNLGHGRFGRKVTMDGAPRFDSPDGFDPRRITLADIDGSGTSDVLYLGRDGVGIFRNLSGNSLAPREAIESLPPTDSLTRTTVVNLLGQGTPCLVWSSPAPAYGERPIAYVNLMGGRKPHLLETIANNLGSETKIAYAPSTRFYLDDRRSGRPWITKLPFPVHVVERVEVFDRISRSRFVTRYAYHHGHYDGAEREFRGFGRVDQWDTEEIGALAAAGPAPANVDAASHVPPVLTRTWYHTGAFPDGERISRRYEDEYYGEPGLTEAERTARLLPDTVLPGDLHPDEIREACRALRGSVLRQEVYALDASPRREHPYAVSERSYTIERLQGIEGEQHGIFFTHAREVLDYHYERSAADPRLSHTLTLEVDPWGNPVRSATIGYGRRQPDAELAPDEQHKQAAALVVYVENDHTNAVGSRDHYRAPLGSEERRWEVTGLVPPGGTTRLPFGEVEARCRAAQAIEYERSPTAGALEKRLLERTRTIYRADDLGGDLPLGHLETLALPARTFRLALTPGLVAQVYGDRLSDAELAGRGGYVHSEGDAGWWVPSGRVFYSPDPGDTPAQELAYARGHFFLPCRAADPFGGQASVRYDGHDLLPLQARDAVGNLTTVGEHDPLGGLSVQGNDYRVLKPRLVMDANRNRAEVAFDALGFVVGTAVMGKPEERLGDSLEGFTADLAPEVIAAQLAAPLADPLVVLQRATTRLIYDLFAYRRTREQPRPQGAVIYSLARETHDAELSAGQATRVQHQLGYSDGLGREIQQKRLARPGPDGQARWVASGSTVHDNKGNPVRRYEPYFSATHELEVAGNVGVSSISFYDPLGRPVGTLRPDHTYEKVGFDPWRRATWDAGDNVLSDPAADPDLGDFFKRLPASEYSPTWHAARAAGALGPEEAAAAAASALYAGTPSVEYLDALGRPFLVVAHNRFTRGATPVEQRYRTRTELDIEGQPREVIDTLNRTVVRYRFDLRATGLHEASMDAGERSTFVNILGRSCVSWDDRGHVFRTEYDALQRPTSTSVKGAIAAEPEREIVYATTVYGEGQADDVRLNLRGRPFQRRDASGLQTSAAYDFKGNLLRSQRTPARDYKGPLDWSRPVALEDEMFESAISFDALNRPLERVTPDGSRTVPAFDEAGLLERLDVVLRGTDTATSVLADVAYNARGQRTTVARGNGSTTDSVYDDLTFELRRLLTRRAGDGALLQDLNHFYDAAGNVASVRDDAQQTLFFKNRRVDPGSTYTHDAVYRLIGATGRELLGLIDGATLPPAPTSPDDWPRTHLAHPNDGNAVDRYRQEYEYDAAGNILALTHSSLSPGTPGWTRRYSYLEPSLLDPGVAGNRLSGTAVGQGTERYAYDRHGNTIAMPHLSSMVWSFKDELQSTARQVVNAGTPETTYYVHDSDGQRVRKVTERANGTRKAERIYLGSFEVYREYEGDGVSVALERETLHILDGERRVVLVETRTRGDDGSPVQLVRHQLDDRLGSAVLELDWQGQIVSYEEYYPFGSTAYQGVRGRTEAPKRYRYSGKERDEETGFDYSTVRYYCPWLCRWTSPDPELIRGGLNVYAYALDNPIGLVDLRGTQPTPKKPAVPYSPWWTPDFDAMCAPSKCLTDREIEEYGKPKPLPQIDERPFETRLRVAKGGAYGGEDGRGGTFPRSPTPAEVWEYGVSHNLFADFEDELVLGKVEAEQRSKAEREIQRMKFYAAERQRAEIESFHNQLNLMPIQAAVMGSGAFGATAARLYLWFNYAQTAQGLHRACVKGSADDCATEAFPLVIGMLAHEVISPRARIRGAIESELGEPLGNQEYFLHGTRADVAKAFELEPGRPLYTTVDPDVALHFARRTVSKAGAGKGFEPGGVAIVLPREVAAQLKHEGLLKLEPITDMPGKYQWVFAPGAAETIQKAGVIIQIPLGGP